MIAINNFFCWLAGRLDSCDSSLDYQLTLCLEYFSAFPDGTCLLRRSLSPTLYCTMKLIAILSVFYDSVGETTKGK